MRCNRKTSSLAVTPLGTLGVCAYCYRDFAATPQLEIPKQKLLPKNKIKKQSFDNQLFTHFKFLIFNF
jgi:hypothetical protein